MQANRGPNKTCYLLFDYITNHVPETVKELRIIIWQFALAKTESIQLLQLVLAMSGTNGLVEM